MQFLRTYRSGQPFTQARVDDRGAELGAAAERKCLVQAVSGLPEQARQLIHHAWLAASDVAHLGGLVSLPESHRGRDCLPKVMTYDPADDEHGDREEALAGASLPGPSRRRRLTKVTGWLVGIAAALVILNVLGVDVVRWVEDLWDEIRQSRLATSSLG